MAQPRVAVIGAGPAGSTAARLLAAHGAEVTLFEGRRLPREKVCGGGLTPKAQRLVPREALGVVERRVDRVELRGPHFSSIDLVEPAATIAMVERSRFDLALVEAAARTGVEIRDGEPVRAISEDDSKVVLRTAGGRFAADAVVVADGEPSGTARQLGLGGPPKRLALALEVDVPFSEVVGRDGALLAYDVPGGYGWYFPKGDHANIGVGSYHRGHQRGLREDLARLGRSLELDIRQAHIRGHWIPQGLRAGPLASRRVVLAGDAAATADSLFGEGISYAILSGVAAAQAIGDWAGGETESLLAYDERLRAVLAPALDRLDGLARTAEISITGALIALHVSRFVRSRAVDAIAGRGERFRIDARCELACACEIHSSEPSPHSVSPETVSSASVHCPRCVTNCAA